MAMMYMLIEFLGALPELLQNLVMFILLAMGAGGPMT
jgi:hypothetical protein